MKIVGMRFYTGAQDYLFHASHHKTYEEQCLYLVPTYNDNKYSVMLHNGKQRLGTVSTAESDSVRKLLDGWKAENGGSDDVIVCQTWYVNRLEDLANSTAIAVRGVARVNERLARKFSALVRKEI